MTAKRFIAFLCFLIFFGSGLFASEHVFEFSTTMKEKWFCLQDKALFLIAEEYHIEANEINDRRKDFLPWHQIENTKKTQDIWVNFIVKNTTNSGDSIFLNGHLLDYTELYRIVDDSIAFLSQSGYLIPTKDHPIDEWGTVVSTYIPAQSQYEFLLRFKSTTKNSKALTSYVTGTCMKLCSGDEFDATYRLPAKWVFFFYGAIIMMTIYNLGISFSTLFKEYLLFSVYNFMTLFAVFVACEHYTGFNLDISLDFIRNIKYIPNVLMVISYLFFAIKFLDLRNYNKRLSNALYSICLLYVIPIFALLFSYYQQALILFSIFTTSAFSITLIIAIAKSKKDKTARFFLGGNLIICAIGLIQLASFFKYITTSQMVITSCIIIMTEIILFSFAIAYKLKVSRRAMLDMKYNNEIQKEKLKVSTLQQKNLELEVNEKARELTTSSVQWLNVTVCLDRLKENIELDFHQLNEEKTNKIIKQINEIQSFEDQWNGFKIHFENVHPGFFKDLEERYPNLTQNDLKVCAFMKMKLSNKEMAIILNVTKRAIEQTKRRMRKKLNLEPEENILKYISDDIEKRAMAMV